MPTTMVGNDDASATEPGRTAGPKPHAVLVAVSELDPAEDVNGRRRCGPGVTSAGLVEFTPPSYGPLPLLVWARRTARRLLAEQLPRRWAHTRGVGHRAEQVARTLPSADRSVLVTAAWLHDIGYAPELLDTGFHPLDGARFLARSGVPPRVCALVAYHSGAVVVAELLGLADQLARFAEEHGPVRDALWYCDMTTSPDGRPVSFIDRIREICARRQSADPVVRALATNIGERAAAVRRTEELLHRCTSGCPSQDRP